jgi:PAS domain S-box-containing protein
MSLPYAYTPQIWPSVLTALLLIALAVYSGRRRSVPGALPFSIALVFGALWMVGISLEIAAVDASAKIFWIKFQAVWLLPSVTGITCFLLEYAWPGRWLTRRNLALLSIPCLLNLAMILTNNLHQLAWQEFVFDGKVNPLNGPGNWVFLVYAYALTLVNLVVLAWLFIRSPQHRWPVALILTGQVAVRVLYALEAVQVIHSELPIEAITFWFPISMYMIALFGFRIFDPIPLARQTVIAQMRDGILVLDPHGRVVSLNPAAETILGVPVKQAQGKPIGELLPGLTGAGSPLASPAALSKLLEMNISLSGEACCYELELSPLIDFRGLPVGHLLLLHDVTEQRRSQARFLEQQRALATLQEREYLARELHDSLGQELAALHLQASTARRLLDRGDTTSVRECLNILVDTTLQAEADMREYLLGAHSVVSADHLFFTTLREYIKSFTRQFGLPVELSVLPDLEGQDLPQAVGFQLLRIIQEGLSNIRKHAHARCAHVNLTLTGASLQVIISDDGLGFEPAAAVTQPSVGYGLRSMRERAEALGGVLQIDSAPGKGTRLVVEVLLEERHGDAVMGRYGE